MNDIDWSKAPEGATHYAFAKNWWKNSWYKVDGDFISCMLDDGQDDVWSRREIDKQDRTQVLPRLISRPVAPAWNGEGLPPVGIECEYLWQWSDKVVYVRIKVLSHDEERAQFRIISGGGIGSLRECNQRMEGELPMFRPIRTPDQIAAEERMECIQEMAEHMKGYKCSDDVNEKMLSLSTYLHDHGYRKIESLTAE